MHNILQQILTSGAVEEYRHREKEREDRRQIIMVLVEGYTSSLSTWVAKHVVSNHQRCLRNFRKCPSIIAERS
jgi:hypothetical protein